MHLAITFVPAQEKIMSSSHPKPTASARKKGVEKAASPVRNAADSVSSKAVAKPAFPKKAAKPASSGAESGNFLLYPPRSPVDVPNFPHPDPALDEMAKQSQPVENDKPESNWADDGTPAPHAKNARSSLL
jgi:hypothetical protein